VEPLARRVTAGRLDALLLFESAMSQDVDRFHEVALTDKDYHGLLRGLASLIAMPMLQSCRRAWAERVPTDWAYGFCRFVVAGRRWQRSAGSTAPGTFDADAVAVTGGRSGCAALSVAKAIMKSSVPSCSPTNSNGRRSRSVTAVRGYVKTMTTLRAIRPEHVVLQDLATVVLDIAALERGYRRPAAKGHEVAVSVVAESSRLRDLLGL